MNEPTQKQLLELWKTCKGFVDEQTISCAECVYQSDRVIENAYELIEKICDIVGYWQEDEEVSDSPETGKQGEKL